MNASHLPLADENGSQASTRIKDRRFSWSRPVFKYALTLWKRRCRFLEYPELKLFSNRAVVVGRKN
jgi:hypothetical protein